MARRAYERAVLDRQAQTVVTEDVCCWSRRWLDQELALSTSDQAKVAAINAHLNRMQDLARSEFRHIENLEYYLTEAELMLSEVRPDPKFDAAIAARKALQGTWQVVLAERKGERVEPPDWDTDTVKITGRRIEFSSPTLGYAWGLITLDPRAVPHRLDFFGLNQDFPFGGHGIYGLEGDKLTLCFAKTKERPKDFSTHKDDDAILYVLERGKREKERPPVVDKPSE